MNDVDKISTNRGKDVNEDSRQHKVEAEKKDPSVETVDAGQFNAGAANLGVNLHTLQKLFKHFDSDHDGKISAQQRDDALHALTSRMNQLMERMEGEIGDEDDAYDDEKDNQAFIGKILAQLANDSEDELLTVQLNRLIQDLQNEGLSPGVLQKTVSLLTEVAPPIDTRA
ncbi:hypothetical protein QX776_06230 [Alteromonadaceae bacterium BrNp21-10]|nr:hypothetical protein [Alteromonadaceae bacterium BrNp21-10]